MAKQTEGTTGVVRRRLPPAERRQQLLDVATKLLEEGGPSAVTMERIAVTAGVDKALPYRYFTNARSILVEMHDSYSVVLGTRVAVAVSSAESFEQKVEAAVAAYLDVLAEHRTMLTLLTAWDGRIPEESDARLDSASFVDELFVAQLGVPRPAAPAAIEVVLAALAGSARAWRDAPSRRAQIERVAVGAVLGAITAARGELP